MFPKNKEKIPCGALMSDLSCLIVMLSQESSTYKCGQHEIDSVSLDHLSQEDSRIEYNHSTRIKMYSQWRHKMCDWSYDVVDHFGFDREVVSISMNFFDRYVASTCVEGKSDEKLKDDRFPSRKRPRDEAFELNMKNAQLLGMTTLFLAIKVHGNQERSDGQGKTCLQIKRFVELSRGQFTEVDILSMEQSVLYTLNWSINPPTPARFVTSFINYIGICTGLISNLNTDFNRKDDVKIAVYELSLYLIEVSMLNYRLSVRIKPSHLALAAILAATDATDNVSLTSEQRLSFLNNIQNLIPMQIDFDQLVEAESKMNTICGRIQVVESTSIEAHFSQTRDDNKCDADSESSTCCVTELNSRDRKSVV